MSEQTLIVFGARQGLGLALVQLACAANWKVHAVVRPGAEHAALAATGCAIHFADALSAEAVNACFRGRTRLAWVVSTLSDTQGMADAAGNIHVIQAAVRSKAKGVLLVSSLGAGDSRAHASDRLLAAIGHVLSAKTLAEEALRNSGLPFCILRPGGLVDGPPRGTAQLLRAADAHGFIRRSDLALMMFRLLEEGRLLDQTRTAIDPSCPPPTRYAASSQAPEAHPAKAIPT
ncbi:NAD(P)H-binding protein [Uliginosibacterium sediminicola]|uniref:NAD(P)H-binding protein n=1 Tax=Uliginosibacterium sediminicola TaxID=2024550 RepID=A0ABU9YZ10_9RHOO